jgi:hypothetical protein
VKCLIVLATLHAVPQAAASQHATDDLTLADAGSSRFARSPIQEAGRFMVLQSTGVLGPGADSSPVHPVFWSGDGWESGSGWRKGALVGGLVGAGAGFAAFLFLDSLSCDSCSGASDSAASGAGPEFVLGLGLVGAAIGVLLGR